jgi:hypothetical protein
MPQDKDRIRLQHMLDHASEAMQMAHGRVRDDLDADRQLNLALVRLLEIGAKRRPASRSLPEKSIPK